MSKQQMDFLGKSLEDIGLDTTGSFNTFRNGGKWSSLKPNDVLNLSFKGNLFGRARVLSVHQGNLSTMLAHHARHNHRVLDAPFKDRPGVLKSLLKKMYGEDFDEDSCTVVYLERKFD